jgi:hypothetical protein
MNTKLGLLLLLSAFLRPLEMRADGGIVRLRQSQGPFTVTVFTPAEILAESSSDVTVLVQDRETAGIIIDADVILRLAPPPHPLGDPKPEYCGVDSKLNLAGGSGVATGPILVRAVHAPTAAKFLYAAPLAFPEAGIWNLEVGVSRAGRAADISGSLAVKAPFSRLAAVAPYLSLPLIIIALFFVNLRLRERRVAPRRDFALALFPER